MCKYMYNASIIATVCIVIQLYVYMCYERKCIVVASTMHISAYAYISLLLNPDILKLETTYSSQDGS